MTSKCKESIKKNWVVVADVGFYLRKIFFLLVRGLIAFITYIRVHWPGDEEQKAEGTQSRFPGGSWVRLFFLIPWRILTCAV